MLKVLAGVPRAQKKARAPKYEDSNRYLRGRVLARLREEAASDGLPLPDLARRLRGDAADVEPVRLKAVVESLERDGLTKVMRPTERVGDHLAVAEERAPYAAGSEREDAAEIRVSLP